MQQYFVNKSVLKTQEIQNFSEKIEDRIFANERIDKNWNKKQLCINNCTFAKMGFKESKFSQCDFSFCVFIDCYFKKALWSNNKGTQRKNKTLCLSSDRIESEIMKIVGGVILTTIYGCDGAWFKVWYALWQHNQIL